MGETLFQYEPKIWGEVVHLFASDHAAVSHLRVKAGSYCSRHLHRQRANQFVVLSGEILIDEWDCARLPMSVTLIGPGQSYTVPSGVLHRFRVLQSGEVIEVYWPDNGGVVRMDDIERFDEGGVI